METLGRYQLIKKLATGGMAEVFLASAEGPGGFSKQLVVKRILPHFADNPQFVQMFLSEAKLAAQLNHPNIVTVFDFGQAGRDYFLAMEFVDGLNLRSLNRMYRTLQGPMPLPACARMISQACEGLAYAHAFTDPQTGKPVKLVHRDISPDNLIISKHGAVKVLDFGIAKAETQVHKTNTGMLKGKMAYMPPEQLQRQPLDQRVDVYALGVVLFELLAGALPFDATSEVSIIQAVMKPEPLPPLSGLVPRIPPALEACVAKALAKSRDERYPDCKAFQEDLESYIQSTGQKCLPSELAALVAAAEKGHLAETGPELLQRATPTQSAFDSTAMTPGEGRPITGVSATALKQVGSEPVAQLAEQGRRSRPDGPATRNTGPPKGAIAAAAVLLVFALAASGYVFFGRGTSAEKNPPVVVPLPPKPADPVPLAVVDAGASPVAVAEPVKPVVEEKRPAKPLAKSKGEVEVRVRPYAVLFVDGTKVGETPLSEPLSLSAGKHAFRMVNDKYEKDVTVDFVVKPGKSVFKHNLLE